MAEDTVLRLYDGKGGWIATNDDIIPAANDSNPDRIDDTNLNSQLVFMAEEDSTYYISASSYANNPEAGQFGPLHDFSRGPGPAYGY